MKRNTIFYAIASILLIAPGCTNLVRWGKETFYQGETIKNNIDKVKSYIRSAWVYDQLSTRGIFDALWLSDQVRRTYANLIALHQGKDAEQTKILEQQQMGLNNATISFYILSLHDQLLGDEQSEWQIILELNNQLYRPSLIKQIELPYEYKLILKDVLTRFKQPYLVSFNAVDEQGNSILSDNMAQIVLYFRSLDKQVKLVWPVHSNNEQV